MSQTAYTQEPAVALEGMLVDASFDKDIVSGIAEVDITFGKFVFRSAAGAADDRPPVVDVPDLTTDVTGPLLIGVALSDVTIEQAATPVGWPANSTVRIMRSGRVWMVTEDAVTYGAPVFVRFNGGNEGGVRSDVDGGNAVALPGASFRSIAGAGEFAIVEYHPQN
jgi:hypothetical protein